MTVEQHADVIRYGNTFYVVGDLTAYAVGDAVPREVVEAHAVAMFTFEGRAVKSNADAQRAYREAKACCARVTR